MLAIRDYKQEHQGAHTVVGTLKVIDEVYSPQLGNERALFIYLPPSYETSAKRYPVIYMHDGQNLFDDATSYAGEWQVDETMEVLSAEGIEAIVVGIPNMGVARLDEYGPFVNPHRGGGEGDAYLCFIIETIKPLIDKELRTLPGRQTTGILGSSMGGLISLYAYFRHPAVFGFAGVMSPSLWFTRWQLFTFIKRAPSVPGKIYLDTGTDEHPQLKSGLRGHFEPRRHLADTRHMYGLMLQKGYRPGKDVLYIEEKGARHTEAAWARRLPEALRFLLTP